MRQRIQRTLCNSFWQKQHYTTSPASIQSRHRPLQLLAVAKMENSAQRAPVRLQGDAGRRLLGNTSYILENYFVYKKEFNQWIETVHGLE